MSEGAANAGQSLQEYLLTKLIVEASTSTIDELLDRVDEHNGGRAGFRAVTTSIRRDRDRR